MTRRSLCILGALLGCLLSVAGVRADDTALEFDYGRCLTACNESTYDSACPSGKVCAEAARAPNCDDAKDRAAWPGYCTRLRRYASCAGDCASQARTIKAANDALEAQREAKRREAKIAALERQFEDAKRLMRDWSELVYQQTHRPDLKGFKDHFRGQHPGCTWWRDIAACETNCRKGNSAACIEVANAYDGVGRHDWAKLADDWAKADAAAERACALGDPMGCVQAVRTGKPAEQRLVAGGALHVTDSSFWPKAFALGKRMCDEHKIGRGCSAVVEYYRHSADQDLDKAYAYAKKGCDYDHLLSCNHLLVGDRGWSALPTKDHADFDADAVGGKAAWLHEQWCTFDSDMCFGYALLLVGMGQRDMLKHVKQDLAEGRAMLSKLCDRSYVPACSARQRIK